MEKKSLSSQVTRRAFVAGSVLGLTSFLAKPGYASSHSIQTTSFTVQQIIDIILREIPGAPFEKTVDTIKSGNAETIVTGIVSTMFATVEVIRKAIELKANFIIAHEPTFYNHQDETTWLEEDGVYKHKRELLEKNNIVVWRFHDYWHTHRPDGVQMGVLTQLDWRQYSDSENPGMINLPATPLKDIAHHLKNKLGITTLRIIGNTAQECNRVLLMPGASGGRSQIRRLMQEQPDLLICGEVAEWETSEYIRDAIAAGAKRSLIVLGHVQSEEPGMKWLVEWLQPKVKNIKVTHIPSHNPFIWA